jgi:hypothetical protein
MVCFPPAPCSAEKARMELTGGMALDFDLWVHSMGLLTAGGCMALHLGPSGPLGLFILLGR